MTNRTKQIFAIVLSGVSAVGTVLTSVLVRKAALKEAVSEKKDLKSNIRYYVPAIVVGTATVASTVTSLIFSRRVEASLLSMATIADQGWKNHKDKVKSILGNEKADEIKSEIAKDSSKQIDISKLDPNKKLYYEEHVGFFETTPEKLAYSYSYINERLNREDVFESAEGYSGSYSITLAQWFNFMKADRVVRHGKRQPSIGDLEFGWTQEYLNEGYSYAWVHMNQIEETRDDGVKFTRIEWVEDPIMSPFTYHEGYFSGLEDPDDDYDNIMNNKGDGYED